MSTGTDDAWDHGRPEHVDADEGEPDIEPFAGKDDAAKPKDEPDEQREHGYGYE